MITLSMATACIGTGGNGVIVDEGTGWREGGREGGREGEGERERETWAVARVIFSSWMMSFHGNHHFSTFLHFWNEFMQSLLHGVDFHVVDTWSSA